MKKKLWQRIESLIQKDRYTDARKLLYRALKEDPKDHWILTRLSTTYYEEYDYQKALTFANKAKALAPNCPLVLWDLAGSLDMLDRKSEAIVLWRKLLQRGPQRVGNDLCGEGLSWARSLLVDCRYRLAKAYSQNGDLRKAKLYYRAYLKGRKEGARSIYNLRTVKKEFSLL